MVLTACNNQVPLVATCPDDSEQVLFFNVSGQQSGMALRSWSKLRCCLINEIFGVGTLIIYGSDLDNQGRYYNSAFINNLLLFASSLPNFLVNETQWNYILDEGNTIGIQILIGYEDTDLFIVFPNPKCS